MDTKLFIFTPAWLLFFTLCHGFPGIFNPTVYPPEAAGLNYAPSDAPVGEIYNTLIAALEKNEKIGLVAEIDHASDAKDTGVLLPDTRVVLFGNPELGTPLMMENQLAGLDLPQKVAVYQTGDGETFLIYNSADYLAARHGLKAPTLPLIANALEKISVTASHNKVMPGKEGRTGFKEGIITIKSTRNYDETISALVQAITADGLKVVATLDHRANAKRVGMELNPTMLIVIGDPHGSAPLIASMPSICIDLPPKMLVWEDEGHGVYLSYNAPAYLASRHKLKGHAPEIRRMASELKKLAVMAAHK